ncbi:kininogen-1 isoform X2 [Rhineura floridana]|uniref:kininogen-1 isoform X2 n=1 Tax=Rhineura floridana TaxID=261503 RepID=UPI002AC82CEB|nr:kininogen-1 isoform X2 [Rhineura floridana]
MELFILLVFSFCCCHASPLQGQEVDCDNPDVFNAVDLALKAFNGDRIDGNKFALNVVLEASRTDSGECTADVHIDDYPKLSAVSQKCKITPAVGKVNKSEATCLGCWHSIPATSLELLPIVRYTIRLYNNHSDQPYLSEVGKIVKAQRQVVAGWRYSFEYLVEETNCSKAEFTDLTPACKAVPAGHVASCTADAIVDFTEMLVHAEQKCLLRVQKNNTAATHCAGCPHHIPTDSPELKKPLAAALEKFNSECSDEFYYKIETITEATSQVVAGIMYRVLFKIKETNCSRAESPKLSEDCHAVEGGTLLTCNASIYERPWMSEIHPKVKCSKELPKFYRRPPGFTPFRSPQLAGISNSKNIPGDGLVHVHCPGHGHRRGRGHGHGHAHKHGNKKQKNKSSKESDEDKTSLIPLPEIPDQPPTSDPLLQDGRRDPNEDLLSPQDSTVGLFSLFDPLPDIPEPPAPQCPGKPWKPIAAPTTTLEDPSHDFTLEDLLPPHDGDAAEPHETTSAPNQRSSGDFDLADVLA